MNNFTIIFIAFGLAMDAFAVSIATGISMKCFQTKLAFRMAIFFGFFQFLMPILGWTAGLSFRYYVETFSHWVAFGLLLFIGGKMIYESFIFDEVEKKCNAESFATLLLLSVATSIDALAVGLSFSVLKVEIIHPVIIIGIVTFLLSFSGVYIGVKIGSFFEKKIEFLGGLVLIAIGVKILLENF
jgi:putative Mn2+ efflux pump MntP